MRVLTARIAEHFCHKAHAGTHVVYLVLVCVLSPMVGMVLQQVAWLW